jgi:hypothetical protein
MRYDGGMISGLLQACQMSGWLGKTIDNISGYGALTFYIFGHPTVQIGALSPTLA